MAETEEISDKLVTETGETYRDRIATIDKQGNRLWVFPKKPKGKLHRARALVSVVLLVILFGTPFIKIDGHPFLMFDILNRHFILFGKSFWPQDFFVFAICFVAIILFIVAFTLAFGRLWCGWACPQTIFMEMVFRKIEYFIDGDANKQRILDRSEWNLNKILKRGLKLSIFFILSFIISNVLLAYFVGIDRLFDIITDPVSEHIGGLTAMVIFSLIFFWVFAWFREQACTLVCPYGRLQGVLLDKNSIVVAYDSKRGEPRGKMSKNPDAEEKGDCIDCKRCVQVCPTGIDIRNGTQLECINCTACIDECNDVMESIKRPRKLIKYASFNNIRLGSSIRLTPRLITLLVLMIVLLGVIITLIGTRKDHIVDIIRAPGTRYQELDDDKLSNLYKLMFVNKTFENEEITLRLSGIQGEIKLVGAQHIHVKGNDLVETNFFVILPEEAIHSPRTKFRIDVLSAGKLIANKETMFLGPPKHKKEIEHD